MTTTATVPGLRQVGLNGVGFMVDDRPGRGIKRRSIPFLRNQADTGSKPGAQSLSPAGQWRSYAEDWSKGAGQSHRDRDDSDPARFRSSKGVNVWDRWKLSLLADTANKRATTTTDAMRVLRANNILYVSDGTELFHTADIIATSPTWTAAVIHAGEAPVTIRDMTTDGATVYAISSTNGVHRTTAGAIVSTHYSDQSGDIIDYVNGRLMVAAGISIFNIIAAGAAPAALFTKASPYYWVGFASGKQVIYAAGHNGDRAEVYRIGIKADGTGLNVPILAAELPSGETVEAIESYLGYVMLGSSKGVRFASADANGDLTLGALIPTPGAVRCFEAQGRYVWYGWTNYDATSSGLGRLDLFTFIVPGTPAYASDAMAGAQGIVKGVATFQERRVFSVTGVGFFAETNNKVPTGTLDTGDISYGITDDKVATALDVSHEVLLGSHESSLSVNGGAFTSLGTHTEGGAEGPFTIPESKGERFEIRHTLNRKATDTTVGPTLTRSTLSTYPVPRRPSEVFEVWLLLHTAEALSNGATESRDPLALLEDIIALERNGTVVDFQLGVQTYRALIEDHQFESESEPVGSWPEGSVGLTVRAI